MNLPTGRAVPRLATRGAQRSLPRASSCPRLLPGLLLLTVLQAPGASQDQPLALRLVALDDRAEPVAGSVIEVKDWTTGSSVLAHTDREGATPSMQWVADHVLGAYLAESPTARGTVLGQYFDLGPLSAGDSDQLLSHQVLFQPLLESRVVSYAQTTLPADHSRWRLIPSGGAKASAPGFSFSAQVGQLLTQREIQAYASYYGVDFGAAGATSRLGVVIRSGEVDIGEQNLCLVVDSRGHGFSSLPAAHVFTVRGAVSDPGPGTFAATAFDMEDEHVFLKLSGVLERGDNIVLLSLEGPPHPLLQLEGSPPQLGTAAPPAPSSPGGGPECPSTQPESDPGGLEEPRCRPVTDPSNACAPDPPSSDPGCPPASPVGDYPNCVAHSYGGFKHCDVSGSITLEVSITVTGSVSTGFKVEIATSELSAGATGSISTGSSYSLGTNMGPGNSGCAACNGGVDECGQCKRLCLDLATCERQYTVTKHDYTYDFVTIGEHTHPVKTKIPCALTQKTTRHCLKIIGTDVAVCNRACP